MVSTTIGQLFGTKQGNDKDNFLVVKDTAVMVFFFFLGDFSSSGLTAECFRQIDVCSDTKYDTGQPEQN